MKLFLGFFAICIAIGILVTFWPLVFFIAAIFAILKVYETFYFTSGKFESIKERIQSYINDCNDLNRHIEDLKKQALSQIGLIRGALHIKTKVDGILEETSCPGKNMLQIFIIAL